MGKGCRHLPHQGDAAKMPEVVPSLFSFQFRLLSSGDIDADSQHSCRLSMLIHLHSSTRCHPADAAIGKHYAKLGVVIAAVINRVVERKSDSGAIVGMQSRKKG